MMVVDSDLPSALQVNSTITSESGGTCVCPRTAEDFTCEVDQDYQLCLGVIKRDIVTATAAVSAVTSVRPRPAP